MIVYPRKAGIYKLTCLENGKIYIGKSVDLYKRINRHKNCRESTRNKYYLQNAIVKYGWSSFTVELLEVFDNFDKLNDNHILLEKESYYINLFETTNKNKGYNICEYSTDTSGIPLTEEHKENIRQSLLGRTFSEETIEKMRQAQLGKKLSNETKEKLRLVNLGKTYSDETKEKIRIKHSGRVFSEEHKEKIKQSKLGTPRSEETKEKIRQSMLSRRNKQ